MAAKSYRVNALLLALFLEAVFNIQVAISSPERCVYLTRDGELKSAEDLLAVPNIYRAKANCGAKDSVFSRIDPPQRLALGANVQQESFSSELGRFNVRWPRSIVGCFSASPGQGVHRAAKVVGKALREGRFLEALGGGGGGDGSSREWEITFTTERVALNEFPREIVLGQHPGFMVPPNRMYLIADNINTGCVGGVGGVSGGRLEPKVVDIVLKGVLLHEFGHIVEYLLLGGRLIDEDRARAEGFAVWFEGYVANFVSDSEGGRELRGYNRYLGSRFGASSEGKFSQDARGYVSAGMRFSRLVEGGGVGGLLRVYRLMREEGMGFDRAQERVFGGGRGDLVRFY